MSEPLLKRQKRTIQIEMPENAIFIEKLPEKYEDAWHTAVYYEVKEGDGKKCDLVCYVRQNYQVADMKPKDAWDLFMDDAVNEIIDEDLSTEDHYFDLDKKAFDPSTMQVDVVFLLPSPPSFLDGILPSSTPILFPRDLCNLSFLRFTIPILKKVSD